LKLAEEQGRVIFTQDADFLRMHAAGHSHAGIAYLPMQTPVSQIIRSLMLLYDILDPDDMKNHVEFL
jgi:hypothetical protein